MIMARNSSKQVRKKGNNHKLNEIKRNNNKRVTRLIEQVQGSGRIGQAYR